MCSTTFDPAAIFHWTHHGVPTDPGPAYRRQLESVLAGYAARRSTPGPGPSPVRVGDRVRLLSPGRYHGFVGVVVNRVRYRLSSRAPKLRDLTARLEKEFGDGEEDDLAERAARNLIDCSMRVSSFIGFTSALLVWPVYQPPF